jgi:hypothetical protein
MHVGSRLRFLQACRGNGFRQDRYPASLSEVSSHFAWDIAAQAARGGGLASAMSPPQVWVMLL